MCVNLINGQTANYNLHFSHGGEDSFGSGRCVWKRAFIFVSRLTWSHYLYSKHIKLIIKVYHISPHNDHVCFAVICYNSVFSLLLCSSCPDSTMICDHKGCDCTDFAITCLIIYHSQFTAQKKKTIKQEVPLS